MRRIRLFTLGFVGTFVGVPIIGAYVLLGMWLCTGTLLPPGATPSDPLGMVYIGLWIVTPAAILVGGMLVVAFGDPSHE